MKIVRKIISCLLLLSAFTSLAMLFSKETLTNSSYVLSIISSLFMYFLSYLVYPFWIHYPLKKLFSKQKEKNEERHIEDSLSSLSQKEKVSKRKRYESAYFSDDDEEFPIDQIVLIHYKDANDELSIRKITIKKLVSYYNDFMLYAYCHEKEANRHFLLSRIQKMIDIETNKQIENPLDYLMNKFYDTDIGKFREFMITNEDQILILVFIARADEIMSSVKMKIIIEYILKLSPELNDIKYIEKEIKRIHCEVHMFRSAVNNANLLPLVQKEELLKYAKQIVYSKKDVDPIAKGSFEKLQKIFNLTPASTL